MRGLSLEAAHIYRVFYHSVINNGLKPADAVKSISTKRDQTAVKRIIDDLGEIFQDSGGISDPLIFQSQTGNRWQSTRLGDRIYEYCKRLEAIADEIENEYIDLLQTPSVRIGINAFSYELLVSVESLLKRLFPGTKYRKVVEIYRSKDIIPALIDKSEIDVGISESVLPINDSRVLSVKIQSQKLHLVTNFPVHAGNISEQRGLPQPSVQWDYIKSVPLSMADTRSFFEMLMSVAHDYASRADLKQFDNGQMKIAVSKIFRLNNVFNSPDVVMDYLIFEDVDSAMIATKEVCERIYQKRNSSLSSRRKIYFYNIDSYSSATGGNVSEIHKYMLFGVDAENRWSNTISQFVEAARAYEGEMSKSAIGGQAAYFKRRVAPDTTNAAL